MSLSLVAADNGNRSVTFTASGYDGTVAIRAARWQNREGLTAWSSIGTLTSPGTLTVTLPSFGPWFLNAYAGAESSAPFLLSVVDGSVAIMNQCEDAVAAQIRRMNLTGIANNVYTQLVPHDTIVVYPCAFVVGNEGIETADGGELNATSSVGYPIRVILMTRDAVTAPGVRLLLGKWRQTVARAFRRQRLPGVPVVSYTMVEYGPRLQQFTYPGPTGQAAFQMNGTVLTIRCTAREPRGLLQ